jgi:hypothetical protein
MIIKSLFKESGSTDRIGPLNFKNSGVYGREEYEVDRKELEEFRKVGQTCRASIRNKSYIDSPSLP